MVISFCIRKAPGPVGLITMARTAKRSTRAAYIRRWCRAWTSCARKRLSNRVSSCWRHLRMSVNVSRTPRGEKTLVRWVVAPYRVRAGGESAWPSQTMAPAGHSPSMGAADPIGWAIFASELTESPHRVASTARQSSKPNGRYPIDGN